MTSKIEHWKKKERRDMLNQILGLLKDEDLRNIDFKTKLGRMNVSYSDPSLSGWLKSLESDEKIEHYQKPQGDRREKWYRIKPENREKVVAQLCRNEAIRFLESFSNPVYVYEHQGNRAIAAFMSLPDERFRGIALKLLKQTVSSNLKFLPSVLRLSPDKRAKIATVIMDGVEK